MPAVLLGAATVARAQNNVGVGTTTPDASAVLDANSTTQGLLVPRMTAAQRAAVKDPATNKPATGLLVYQTDAPAGFYVYNGTAWAALSGAGSTGPAGADGKNSLVRTTAEAAGANCATGGFKTEYGLDANANGTLDAAEVNAALTRYVCNGAQGTTGSTGATGPAGQGVPTGGTAGQVLSKVDGNNYNTQWTTPSASAAYPSIELSTSVTSSQTVSALNGTNTFVPLVFSSNNSPNAALTGGNTWNGTVFTVGSTGAGWYQVSAQIIAVTSGGGFTPVGIQFFLDKNNAIGNALTPSSSSPYALSTFDYNSVNNANYYRNRGAVNTIIYLAAGDQITLRGQSWSSTVTSYTSTDGSSNLQIVRLK
ncbi:hypothetical protein GCM10027044_13970 [Hymenobacter ruber]